MRSFPEEVVYQRLLATFTNTECFFSRFLFYTAKKKRKVATYVHAKPACDHLEWLSSESCQTGNYPNPNNGIPWAIKRKELLTYVKYRWISNALCSVEKSRTQKAIHLHDSVFLTFWKRQNSKDRNQIGDWQGLGWGEGLTTKGPKGIWGVMELCYISIVVVTVYVCQNLQNSLLKGVTLTICK